MAESSTGSLLPRDRHRLGDIPKGLAFFYCCAYIYTKLLNAEEVADRHSVRTSESPKKTEGFACTKGSIAGASSACSKGEAWLDEKVMHITARQVQENTGKAGTTADLRTSLWTESVQAELERVLASKSFSNSPRLTRFLRFTVELTIQGHGERIKEYLLGVEVFDRGGSYDPHIDPIVRVEAGRLRTKLQGYYASDGAHDPLVIEFQKGSYIPTFHTKKLSKIGDAQPWARMRLRLGLKTALLVAAPLMLGVVAYWLASLPSRKLSLSEPAAVAGAPTSQARSQSLGAVSSIAVLPFEDLSPQKDQAYFCDGMTETLIDTLTKVEGLRVAARTSAFAFKGKQSDIGTIGEKLHVGFVLEGSVRKEDKRLRVTAQLVGAADGLNIWSEIYDIDIKDVFAIQDKISWAIVSALKNKFVESSGAGKQIAKAYTRNPEAYSLYLKGRYHLARMSRVEINKSMGYFARAIAEDPNYALAYAGIAEAYNSLGDANFSPPHEVMPKAKSAATKALEIDDSLAEAHAAFGLVESVYEWNWRRAEQEFKRAIELNPGYASAHQWYGLTCLASTGRLAEAAVEIRRALDLDPLSLITNTNLATISLRQGQYANAIERYRETIDLEPTFFWAYRDLGLALNQKLMFKDAIKELEKADGISNGNSGVLAALGYCYAMAGNQSKAQRVLNRLKELSKGTYVPPYHIAAVYAGLGDKERAFEWLDRAFEDRSTWMNGIKVDPLFASLHTEPRFVTLLKKMGLEE